MRMLGTRSVTVYALLGGLLVLCNPIPLLAGSWQSDTSAHFGKNGVCTAHMDNMDPIGPTQTLALCVGQSAATQWYGEIRNYTGSVIVCSTGLLEPVGNGIKTFSCNPPNAGYYKGYVTWMVSGSSQTMTHAFDYYFKK